MDIHRLEQIEKRILDFFETQQRPRILVKELFSNLTDASNADIVRTLEAMEKKSRLLVRHTSEGDDYLSLTPDGAALVGINGQDAPSAIPHPPKSATKRI
jgi:DNA-binding MarR family transcriptional regulator